uniref:Uncharacterized protein n=1 Tax=Drosophila pseudoobscura pseudoobscura TaxID=46245 RepID=B5DUC3_DROPS
MASPRKILRYSMQSNENEKGKTCSDVLEELKKTTETLKLGNAVIRDQLNAVIQILADQTVLIKQLVKEKGELNPIRGQFPIKREEELVELEEKIKLNRDIYITPMKSILKPAGVLSGLNFILVSSNISDGENSGSRAAPPMVTAGGILNRIVSGIRSAYLEILVRIPMVVPRNNRSDSTSNRAPEAAIGLRTPNSLSRDRIRAPSTSRRRRHKPIQEQPGPSTRRRRTNW